MTGDKRMPTPDPRAWRGDLRASADRSAALWPCFICRAPGACAHREADLLLWMMRRPPARETRGASQANAARREARG